MVGGAVSLRYASGMLLPTPPPLPNRCWDVMRFVEKVLCEPLNRELGRCLCSKGLKEKYMANTNSLHEEM